MHRAGTAILLLTAFTGVSAQSYSELARGFHQPPPETRPQTYWLWMNGHVTRDGITRDLEAMSRVGIGGVIIFDGGPYLPKGPVDYLSPEWHALMEHAAREGARLGISVGMHNAPGWSSSGGPWITPERSMQELEWSETTVTGPARKEVLLPQPKANLGYYRDAFVLAFPAAATARIENWRVKANFAYRIGQQVHIPAAGNGALAIDPKSVLDLSSSMNGAGRLTWDVPPGAWTILRLGHTTTGKRNVSASEAGSGLECDKMSRAATEFHFEKVVATVPGLKTVMIDSYEAGMQNWTAAFPEEFRKRAGYDLRPYLPAMTGRVVGDAALSERFLFDVRRVQADLMAEYYYGRMGELCRRRGLKFYVEGYGPGVFDELQVSGIPDFPMTEFWERTPWSPNRTVKMVSSAAHIYGKGVVAGESFTGEEETSRWLEYPYSLKIQGDLMFSLGLNEMVFHRSVHQPHPTAVPGMTMGPWGFFMDRTNTWFAQSGPWLKYLARAQYLLRQGAFVADVLYFTGERPPGAAQYEIPALPSGYTYDLVNADVLIHRARVRNGRNELPGGGSYRVLVLPPGLECATPELMRKLRELVTAGAKVVGPKLQHSPTLRGYPESEAEVRQIAGELWDRGAIATQLHLDAPPDFEFQSPRKDTALSWCHRKLPEGELYFVANRRRRWEDVVAAFRVSDLAPEFWNAETGEIRKPSEYSFSGGRVRVPIRLGPAESVFVVFHDPGRGTRINIDGSHLFTSRPTVEKTFSMTLWAKPDTNLRLMPKESTTGWLDETGKFYAIPAGEGDLRYGKGHASAGLAIGRNGVYVVERSSTSAPAVLVADIPIAGWTHFAVVYRAGKPRLYVNGQFVRNGLVSGSTVHPGVDDPPPAPETVFHFAALDNVLRQSGRVPFPSQGLAYYFEGNMTQPEVFGRALDDEEVRAQAARGLPPPEDPQDAGSPARVIGGPWHVAFQEGRGAPAAIELPELISWHRHSDPGVKYFSGTATYSRRFELPASWKHVYLDLGRVEVIADVRINGRDLGTLWKEPYRVAITDAVHAGLNDLEIRVTNLWANRLIGDEQLPPENEYGTAAEHGILRLPEWYLKGLPKPPGGRITFATWKFYSKDEPLLESGLLGPVRLIAH